MVGSLFRLTCYPVVLGGAVFAAAIALRHFNAAIVVAVLNALVALLVAGLERVRPYRAQWNQSHDDVRTDVLHMVFAMLPVPVLFRAATFGALTAGSIWLAGEVGRPLWPSQWPLPVQLVLALVVAEFGQYWVHRLAHESSAFWRLHSVHHSVERLYWLNAGRFHPIDTLLQHAAEMVPLLLLGASEPVLVLFTVFTSANGLLRHANIDMRFGVLNWVLSTADLHRWHHSDEPRESNSNYGANLILWDVIFRSRQVPADQGPHRLGLRIVNFPRTFVGLLVAPFRSAEEVRAVRSPR